MIVLHRITIENATNLIQNFGAQKPEPTDINAFNFDWSSENNWLFPPPNLICDTIKKVLKENAKCTLDLIVPEWKSAPHWPMIFSERYLKPSIMAKEIFTGLNFTHRGRGQTGIFGKKEQAFRFIALRILFSRGFSFF